MNSVSKAMKSWQDAKFGMMIHWGLYSAPAGEWKGQTMDYIGEWLMSKYRIPIAEYERIAESFNPEAFDADEWVSLAKKAGMGYMIFTAKHHDGFAMFHSECDKYNIVDATPFKRDPVAELAAACERQGLSFGVYYSQALDWHEIDAGGTERGLGLNHGTMHWGNDWDFPDVESKDFSRYFEKKVKPQIRELLTRYGKLSHIWFDCPFTISRAQCEELYALVKSLQPEILVNSRLGNGLGDFKSLGDNMIPNAKLGPGWEAVATLNDTWGYKKSDSNWKSSKEIVELLSGLAGKGINYLLNVGPDALGRIPEPSVKALEKTGRWMAVNGEAIVGAEASPFAADLSSGPSTCRAGKLYLHLAQWPQSGEIALGGLKSRVKGAHLLSSPEKRLTFEQELAKGTLRVELPARPPAGFYEILAVDVEGTPEVEEGLFQAPDGSLTLPSALAKIHRDADSAPKKGSGKTTIEPDGKKDDGRHELVISPLGACQNWRSTSEWLSWRFKVSKPGKYEAVVCVSGLWHSKPCQEGQRIAIECQGSELQAKLKIARRIDSVAARCYAQAECDCGKIELSQAGECELTLKALEIEEEGVGLPLLGVSLRPA